MGVVGTCEICARGRDRDDSDYEWETGDGNVAGDMVFRVSEGEAFEAGGGYDSGGEELIDEYMFKNWVVGERWSGKGGKGRREGRELLDARDVGSGKGLLRDWGMCGVGVVSVL